MGRIYPHWEEKQYLQHFRVSKDSFWYLCQTYGKKKQTTCLRHPLPPPNRLAIVLYWLAQANSYCELATMYAIGKSTVVVIAHEGMAISERGLFLRPSSFLLAQVMVDFEALCGLPCCSGALDGTFMPIKKPADFGYTYFCYMKFTAINVLASVDARGIFTYVNAGRPGSVGNSYTYWHSVMCQKVASGEWNSSRTSEGVSMKPFVVADSDVPLKVALTCKIFIAEKGSVLLVEKLCVTLSCMQ